MKKLREIVKDAYKCDGLVFQFEGIDASDKWLGITHNSLYTIKQQVNIVYSDEGIIEEAMNRLSIGEDNPNDKDYIKENRQLRKFLKKYPYKYHLWATDKALADLPDSDELKAIEAHPNYES